MYRIIAFLFIASCAISASCDVRSETAKREMEKYSSTPEPARSPVPEPTPIDPKEVLTVDTTAEGPTVSIDGYELKKTADCTKFNRLMINGDKNLITVKGVCRQVMVNGDGNEVGTDAIVDVVMNGDANVIRYARYANGKRPIVTENKSGNIVEKVDGSLLKQPKK